MDRSGQSLKDYRLLVSPSTIYTPSTTAKSITRLLGHQIKTALGNVGIRALEVRASNGEITVRVEDPVASAEAVSKIPGVEYAAVVEAVKPHYEDIVNLLVDVGRKLIYPGESFALKVKLTGVLEYQSRDIEVAASSMLLGELAEKDVRHDTSHPDKTLYALIAKRKAYVFHTKYLGPEGQVVGSKGEALCLLSGDMHSSVATWLIARSGVFPHLLHINPHLLNGERRVVDAIRTAATIREHIPVKSMHVSIVNFDEVFDEIKGRLPRALHGLAFKKLMVHGACKHAEQLRLEAVVFGDDPSSKLQTLVSMMKLSSSYSKSLLIPTLGLTENEVLRYGQQIGLDKALLRAPADRTLSALKFRGDFDASVLDEVANDILKKKMVERALQRVRHVNLRRGTKDLHAILNQLSSSD